jgi:hypothetical protein
VQARQQLAYVPNLVWRQLMYGAMIIIIIIIMRAASPEVPAEYVTLAKKQKFSHPSLVFFFSTPPIKLKPGLQIGGRLLISSQLDESLWLTNQKLEAAVRSITNQPGGAEYVTLAKKLFLTSKFSFSFLWTPPIKSKPGLQVGDY